MDLNSNYNESIDESLNNIQKYDGVQGTIYLDKEGMKIQGNLDTKTAAEYAQLMSRISKKVWRFVRLSDPSNDLTFLKMRSNDKEIVLTPDKDFILMAIQNIMKSD